MADYTLSVVTKREELDAFIEMWWNARHWPYVAFSWILSPAANNTDEARAQALAESQERVWNEAQQDSRRQWLCVKDRDGQVVGGMQWQQHLGSPFPNGCPQPQMHWWPQGPERAFVENMMAQAMTPRCLWMQREHGGISIMIVHPKHRCRGVGSLMMRWVTEKLDTLGLEGFIEASEDGKICYQKHGFQPVMKLDFFLPPGQGNVGQKLQHEMKLHPINIMWRPVRGEDLQGRTRPWQLGPQIPI